MSRRLLVCIAAIVPGLGIAVGAQAAFVLYSGDATQEALWQAAAGGGVPIEDFESFTGTPNLVPTGDPLITLPALHVSFDGPPYPGVYKETLYAHSGANQWSNFGAGAGNASNHIMRVEPGYSIYAVGFWNCDPQGNQPMDAYDFNDQFVGTVTAPINTHPGDPANSDSFGGFVSSVPIKYLIISGLLGDGWNHFDDLQVSTRETGAVPEPLSFVVWAVLGFIGPGIVALRKKYRRA